MKRRAYTLLAGLGLLTAILLTAPLSNDGHKIAPAQAAELRCMTRTPFVQVNPIIRRTRHVRDMSSANLTKFHKDKLGNGTFIGGTGGGKVGLDTDIRYEIKTQGNQGCVSIKSIKGVFYAEPVIHIASDFVRGSCEYRAVLEHEQKHIDVLKDFHRKHDFDIKQEIRALAKHYQSKGPIPADRVKQQQHYIHNKIQEHVRAYSARIMQELNEQQQQVDTPEEYARVKAQCTGWGRVHLH